jgi:ribosomal protein S27AE
MSGGEMIDHDEVAHIIQCPNCGTKNRIGEHSGSLRPICGRCRTPLESSPSPSRSARASHARTSSRLFNALIIVALVGVSYGIMVTPRILKKDYPDLIAREQEKTARLETEEDKHLAEVEARLQKELSRVDAAKLRQEAVQAYKCILDSRKSFGKKYALTPREKAQLRMRNLATDATKSYHQAIKAIAEEASPRGADMRVSESFRGIALHIDFDMSSMTSGEHGIRTKHHTKESLKKEVVSLISRVTNDLFQFCKDTELETIHVGCRHYVRTRYPSGKTKDENTVLFRILIRKSRLPDLSHNPFLDIYSTTRYFEVGEDNFANIEIITTGI